MLAVEVLDYLVAGLHLVSIIILVIVFCGYIWWMYLLYFVLVFV